MPAKITPIYRKAGDGTFPHLVDVVSEISPDNFYLIIDESEEFVSGESQLLDEGSAEQHEVDKSLTPEVDQQTIQGHFREFKRNYRVKNYNSFFHF